MPSTDDWTMPVQTCLVCDKDRDPLDVPDEPCGHGREYRHVALVPVMPRRVTDEMVERVAVGMVGNGDPDYWRCLSEPQKEWHRGRARRALDAAFTICAMRGDEPPRLPRATNGERSGA